MKLLPIGTVLEKEENKVMILGYYTETRENAFYHYYIVAGYPFGYIESSGLAAIPVGNDAKILMKGYESEAFQKFIKNKGTLFEMTEEKSVSVLNAILEEEGRKLEQYMKGAEIS